MRHYNTIFSIDGDSDNQQVKYHAPFLIDAAICSMVLNPHLASNSTTLAKQVKQSATQAMEVLSKDYGGSFKTLTKTTTKNIKATKINVARAHTITFYRGPSL